MTRDTLKSISVFIPAKIMPKSLTGVTSRREPNFVVLEEIIDTPLSNELFGFDEKLEDAPAREVMKELEEYTELEPEE